MNLGLHPEGRTYIRNQPTPSRLGLGGGQPFWSPSTSRWVSVSDIYLPV
jgi:hypothetical protein